MKSLIWEDRGQILEIRSVLQRRQRITIHRLNIQKCCKFLLGSLNPAASHDHITSL